MTATSRLRTVAILTALALGLTALAASGAPTAGAVPPPTVPVIRWSPCADNPALQCATVSVPLDYDLPFGATIQLALIRVPAPDPARRLGSIFVNPGGPGGSGVDWVSVMGPQLAQELRGRFDVVGFDPRGIGRSTPVVCFRSDSEFQDSVAPWPYPLGTQQEVQQAAYDARLAQRCAQRGGPLLAHMSTANVVRDLDLLRAAVGDSSLTYLGYSYGSQIGTTYANFYPHRVRAMVLDGVLDPVAWTSGRPDDAGPFSYRLHSDLGARATLDQFLARCDRAAKDTVPATVCAFGPNARNRFDALDRALRAAPIDLGGGESLTEPDLIATVLGGLYSPFVWPAVADLLAQVERRDIGGVAAARHTLATQLGVTPTGDLPQTVEGFNAVACTDSDNPTLDLAWPLTAAAAEAYDGYFGRIWTWASSACRAWPARDADRYVRPWSATTLNPVLVVGTRYDPATRYHGAVQVAKTLPNSRLLTNAGWGHTVYLTGASACADTIVSNYLLTRAIPLPGATCPAELDPFRTAAGVGGAPATASAPVVGLPAAVRRALAG